MQLALGEPSIEHFDWRRGNHCAAVSRFNWLDILAYQSVGSFAAALDRGYPGPNHTPARSKRRSGAWRDRWTRGAGTHTYKRTLVKRRGWQRAVFRGLHPPPGRCGKLLGLSVVVNTYNPIHFTLHPVFSISSAGNGR
jgi:hypothetical protein